MKELFEFDEKSAKGHNVWKRKKQKFYLNPVLIPTVVDIRGKIPAFLKPNFVYIGRKTGEWHQSKWANPFRMKNSTDTERKRVLEEYTKWLEKQNHLLDAWEELVGRILGCWCTPKPCHGNILAKLVRKRLSKFPHKQVIVIRAMKPYIGEKNDTLAL